MLNLGGPFQKSEEQNYSWTELLFWPTLGPRTPRKVALSSSNEGWSDLMWKLIVGNSVPLDEKLRSILPDRRVKMLAIEACQMFCFYMVAICVFVLFLLMVLGK